MHARLLLGDVGGAYQAGRIWSVTGGRSTSNPKNPGMCSRGQIMRFSLVTTFAAALLLAACSTPSEEAATTSGSGSSRSEAHTSELQSLMRISYAVFCLKKTQH